MKKMKVKNENANDNDFYTIYVCLKYLLTI